MGGHRVPGAARGELGHAHLELAAGNDLLDQQTVDRALVALLQGTEVHHHGVLLGNLLHAGLLVGGGGAEVEVRGLRGVDAAERDVAVAATDVDGLLVGNFILLVTDFHDAGAADVDDADLAALGEVVGAEDFRGLEDEFLIDGDGAAGDDAVEHGIDHVDLAGNHDVLHEVLLADALGVVMLGVDVAGRLADGAIHFTHITWAVFRCKRGYRRPHTGCGRSRRRRRGRRGTRRDRRVRTGRASGRPGSSRR